MKEIVRIGGEAKLSNGFFVVTVPIRGFEKIEKTRKNRKSIRIYCKNIIG